MICIKCGKEFFDDYRKDPGIRKTSSPRFCSRSCSNLREVSENQKKKTSESLNRFWKGKKKEKIPKVKKVLPATVLATCKVCGSLFEKKRRSTQSTCSLSCRYYVLSLTAQKRVARDGCYASKRRMFDYKFVSLECDSTLEEAAIIYLVEIIGIVKIERYRNILNYWEGDSHRTFNPDFWVTYPEGDRGIVEVKMTWTVDDRSHIYNRVIPLKKAALDQFCKEKNLRFLWLDFEYDSRLKDIYRDLIRFHRETEN